MYDVLAGIRVVELSQWAFVPSAAAVLADWGAEVIKIVHPREGDPMKGALSGGLPLRDDGVSFMWEIANRGKRSIGLDVAHPEGKAVLEELVKRADVFMTSFLPPARRRLGVDIDDIRRLKPDIIYARGSATGPRGPEGEDGGFDSISFWARGGITHTLSEVAGQYMPSPGPGAGDLPAGFCLAGGVAAALLRRERTGKGAVVDASLLAAGMWLFGGSISASELYDRTSVAPKPHHQQVNPLATGYETSDGRHILLAGFVSDRYWRTVCKETHRLDLLEDPRFATAELRMANNSDLIAVLDDVFATHTLAEWRVLLADLDCPWSTLQTAREVVTDPQTVANGYLPEVTCRAGIPMRLPASPVQFDEASLELEAAPDFGEQTEQILLELGHDWADISRLKDEKAIQ